MSEGSGELVACCFMGEMVNLLKAISILNLLIVIYYNFSIPCACYQWSYETDAVLLNRSIVANYLILLGFFF